MTREEAIKELERTFDVLDHSCHMDNRRKEAFNMARVALFAEPCEDAISRQAVDDAIYDYSHSCDVNYGQIMEYIDKIPSVTPKQKMGRWIPAKVGKLFPSNDYKCSECGNILDFDGVNCGRGDANYCPNCGAKMAESEG